MYAKSGYGYTCDEPLAINDTTSVEGALIITFQAFSIQPFNVDIFDASGIVEPSASGMLD
jgi:hypothetical protein